jgi:hypothetical protein
VLSMEQKGATACEHLSLLDSRMDLKLTAEHQTLKTCCRWAMGLAPSSPPTTQNSVLPLLSRARKVLCVNQDAAIHCQGDHLIRR